MTTLDPPSPSRPGLRDAAPFWVSLGLVPVVGLAALLGGWWLLLIPASTWGLFALLDVLLGEDRSNLDPATPDPALFWHRAITLVWPFVQAAMLLSVSLSAVGATSAHAQQPGPIDEGGEIAAYRGGGDAGR